MWWSVALAMDVCPVGDTRDCSTVQEAVDAALPGVSTTLQLLEGVYRSPVDVGSDKIIVLDGSGAEVTFAASASDPRMDGRVAQLQVSGEVRLHRIAFGPVNTGAVRVTGGSLDIDQVSFSPAGTGWGLWAESSDVQVSNALFFGGFEFEGAHAFVRDSALVVDATDFVGAVSINAGGSIRAVDSALTVSGSDFSACRSERGGALAVSGGSLVVTDSHFVGNQAEGRGGAILADDDVDVRLSLSALDENTSGAGGGLALIQGDLEVNRTTFCHNNAEDDGGGLLIAGTGVVRGTNLRFLDNAARNGGALHTTHPDATVVHSSFLGNRATEAGAAVSAREGKLQMGFSNFSWNTGSRTVDVALTGSDPDEPDAWTAQWPNVHSHANEVSFSNRPIVTGCEQPTVGDPMLRGYVPGQACGLLNDFHQRDAPLDRVRALCPSIDISEICEAPESPCTLVDPPNILGAFGGPCGFPAAAHEDCDEDGDPKLYDCDDDDAAVSSLVEEIWGDGIDENCDGQDDFDRDGDGFPGNYDGGTVAIGEDCDDTDPSVYPGAPETDLAIDANCNGRFDATGAFEALSGCATVPAEPWVVGWRRRR